MFMILASIFFGVNDKFVHTVTLYMLSVLICFVCQNHLSEKLWNVTLKGKWPVLLRMLQRQKEFHWLTRLTWLAIVRRNQVFSCSSVF
jgi:hypothetical protein